MKTVQLDTIIAQLKAPTLKDPKGAAVARHDAITLLEDLSKAKTTCPETCQKLLLQVIKPLYSATKHHALTSTGRKVLVPSGLPTTSRFSDDHLFGDDSKKPWKNSWTFNLLVWIISSYSQIPDQATRRKTLESHFPLLVPPILNTIDDVENQYKISGFELTELLSLQILSCNSEILTRTGLAEVFLDALTPAFLYLPSLTEEDDSIRIMTALYPSYIALVAAITQQLQLAQPEQVSDPPKSKPLPSPQQRQRKQARQPLLPQHITLLTPTLLHTITNAIPYNLPSHPKLVLALLSTPCLPSLLHALQIHTVPHLHHLLPLLRSIITDPLHHLRPKPTAEVSIGHAVVKAALDVLIQTVQTCWPRIRETWWTEILRGVVGCWMVVVMDEEEEERQQNKERKQAMKSGVIVELDSDEDEDDDGKNYEAEGANGDGEHIQDSSPSSIKGKLQFVIKLLSCIVDKQTWQDAEAKLLKEEDRLQHLLEP